MELSKKWIGTHDGVKYQVSHHGVNDYAPHGTWCGYLVFFEEQLPAEVFKKAWRYRKDYFRSPLANLDWHGGITFCEPNGEKGKRSIKVGCDYAHLFDDGMRAHYDEEYVERELHEVIKDAHRNWAIKYRCPWDGSWFLKEDGVPGPGEKLYSKSGLAAHTAAFKKSAD